MRLRPPIRARLALCAPARIAVAAAVDITVAAAWACSGSGDGGGRVARRGTLARVGASARVCSSGEERGPYRCVVQQRLVTARGECEGEGAVQCEREGRGLV